MVQLLLGSAGTGKTEYIYRDIQQKVQAGERALLLIPEQFSLESECALYDRLGAKEFESVQVLSFTRLCHKIFYQYGQVAAKRLEKPARQLLMSLAVLEVQDRLCCYQRQVGTGSFATLMLETVEELKNAGVTPEALRLAGKSAGSSHLEEKTADISLIFQCYDALTARSGRDPLDDIPAALSLLPGETAMLHCHIYLDGFTALMAPEWQMIVALLSRCKAFTAAFTAESLTQGEESPMAVAAKSANRLVSFAREAGHSVHLEKLGEPKRPKTVAMQHLYQCLFREAEPFMKVPENLAVLAAENVYQEAEAAARAIRYLVDFCGYRYREIALICREIIDYQHLLIETFDRYRIPASLDRRESVQTQPLCRLILSALDAITGSFDTGAMLSLAKLPLLGIPQQDACYLENYCFIWNVRGKLWTLPFENNPDGLDAERTPERQARLAAIESARMALVGPLLHLKERLSEGSGTAFSEGLYQYLIETGALSMLESAGEITASEEYLDLQAALYGAILGILENIHDLIGERVLGISLLCELFSISLSAADVGKLPEVLDCVLCGSADRIRPGSVRAVLLLGAAEGEFPRQPGSGGVLSEGERQRLMEGGVELMRGNVERRLLERFFAYFSATLPTHRLMISYPKTTLEGKKKQPGELFQEILTLFPKAPTQFYKAENAIDLLASAENALRQLAGCYYSDSSLRASLQAALSGSVALSQLERAKQYSADKLFSLTDKQLAQQLFGNRMTLSPSRLERYYGCAFAYFCESGLKLRTLRKAEFSPLDSGSLIHYVLECMVRRYCKGALTLPETADLEREIGELMNEFLGARIEDREAMGERYFYLYQRLTGLLCRLVEQLFWEFSQSDFTPAAFELPIGGESEHAAFTVKTPGGATVSVRGIVDRVDICQIGERRYLRVVDYKSGQKLFSLWEVLSGLNMQMLLYLFTLTENGGEPFGGAIPAGVLYMPARERVVEVERGTDPTLILTEHKAALRMNGLLLGDLPVLEKMEHGLSGVYLPVKQKKDGSLDAHSSVATLEEFGKIRGHIETLIGEMADSLLAGEIPALPISKNNQQSCRFCDYQSICRWEQEHPARELLPKTDREVFIEMGRGEQDAAPMDNQSTAGH